MSDEIKPEPKEIVLPADTEKIKATIDEYKNESSEIKTEKRGRPKKIKPDVIIDDQKSKEFAESIQGVGSMVLQLLVVRLPNPKPLDQLEVEMFDKAFSKVAYKYAKWLGDYQEESALVLISAMILVPRFKTIKPIEPEKEPIKEK